MGIGRARQQPVARNGKTVIRTQMPLALTYDHRALDGATAAAFMESFVTALEDIDKTIFELEPES